MAFSSRVRSCRVRTGSRTRTHPLLPELHRHRAATLAAAGRSTKHEKRRRDPFDDRLGDAGRGGGERVRTRRPEARDRAVSAAISCGGTSDAERLTRIRTPPPTRRPPRAAAPRRRADQTSTPDASMASPASARSADSSASGADPTTREPESEARRSRARSARAAPRRRRQSARTLSIAASCRSSARPLSPLFLPDPSAASAMTIASAPAAAAIEPAPATRVLNPSTGADCRMSSAFALRDALVARRSGAPRRRDRAPRACARSRRRAGRRR